MMTTDQAWELIKGDTMPMDEAIKSIQLDAFKSGMTEAAEKCRFPELTQEGERICDEILTARDQKTSL